MEGRDDIAIEVVGGPVPCCRGGEGIAAKTDERDEEGLIIARMKVPPRSAPLMLNEKGGSDFPCSI